MRNLLLPLAFTFLAACSSLPKGWVSPTSTQGELDNFYEIPHDDNGTVYQTRWRGNDRDPERSLWRLDAAGDLDERVTPWGPWWYFKVTAPGVVFARNYDTSAWTRFTDSGATALALPDCVNAFDKTDSEGQLRHYMELDNPKRIAVVDPMGEVLHAVPGDRIIDESGLFFVSLDRTLVNITKFDLSTITDGPPVMYRTSDWAFVYVVPMDGHLRCSFGNAFANERVFDELQPVRFPGSTDVAAWIAREVGQDGLSLLGEIFKDKGVDHFLEIVELGDYTDGFMGADAGHYDLIMVRVEGEDEPYRVLHWSEAGKVIATGSSPVNLISLATSELTIVRAQAIQAKNAKQQAEYDAYIAEKERLEAAEREAVAEAARRRRVAREALLVALREGGFSDSEIARNESDGVPMIVVEGKSYAGQRLETWDDIDYPGGIRWEDLPTGFTVWGGGRWVGALMTQDSDGIRRALTFLGGYLDARPASYLEGLYVLPMSIEETLETCSACGGDGVETGIAEVERYQPFGGLSRNLETVKIGHTVSSGHWVTTEKWTPNECPRCHGHGVTPF